MAEQEKCSFTEGRQVNDFLHRLYEVFPPEIAENLDKSRVGMGAAIKMLYDEKGPITAGDIANKLEISTARVAVVIKNMESKDLVVKTKDPKDRRVTLVELTEKGREIYEIHQQRFLKSLQVVIDEVGQDKIDQFFETAEQMKNIFYRETHSC